MTSLFDIRDKAQRAEGKQPDGVQLEIQPASPAIARRTLPPFTSLDGSKNYRAMYRAICEYHERNNPPHLTLEYWEKAAEDISATASRFNNDPFIFAMLGAVYDELEHEYKTLEAGQQGSEHAF